MNAQMTVETQQAWPRKAVVCGLVKAVNSHDPSPGFAARHAGNA
jgi:hypothetical protein